MRDVNNRILVGAEDKRKRWEEYVKVLFNDVRPKKPPKGDAVNESSPEITKEEVIRAIRLQKNDKAVGPDQIHAETLKLIADADGEGLTHLTSLFNSIYQTEIDVHHHTQKNRML